MFVTGIENFSQTYMNKNLQLEMAFARYYLGT